MIAQDDIRAAFDLIRPHVRYTPAIQVDGAALGLAYPVTLKLELLQHTGSFKPRGAFNNLLSRVVPEAGVVAASGADQNERCPDIVLRWRRVAR